MAKPLDLVGCFRLQARVIGALMFRELHTRYGRENLGFLWIIAEPIMFCAGVAVVWTAIRPPHDHGLPVTAIVITGYVPLTMWRHCLSRSVKAFEANGSLLFHRQVTPLDVILSRVTLELIGTLAAGVLISIAAIIMGFMTPPQDYGLLYLGLFYQMILCLVTALIFASLSELSEIVEKSVTVFSYLSIPFSGAFTMVGWLPQKLQWFLLLSPSVHNIEMIRGGQFGTAVHARYDLFYDTWISLLLLIIGLSLTLRIRRHIVIY